MTRQRPAATVILSDLVSVPMHERFLREPGPLSFIGDHQAGSLVISHLRQLGYPKLTTYWSNQLLHGIDDIKTENIVVIGGPLFNKAADWLIRTADVPFRFELDVQPRSRSLVATARPYQRVTSVWEEVGASGATSEPKKGMPGSRRTVASGCSWRILSRLPPVASRRSWAAITLAPLLPYSPSMIHRISMKLSGESRRQGAVPTSYSQISMKVS